MHRFFPLGKPDFLHLLRVCEHVGAVGLPQEIDADQIGVDRKGPAHGQSDAIDPKPTFRALPDRR
jgi:hypothetical protein